MLGEEFLLAWRAAAPTRAAASSGDWRAALAGAAMLAFRVRHIRQPPSCAETGGAWIDDRRRPHRRLPVERESTGCRGSVIPCAGARWFTACSRRDGRDRRRGDRATTLAPSASVPPGSKPPDRNIGGLDIRAEWPAQSPVGPRCSVYPQSA